MSDGIFVTRDPGATVFLPNRDEWQIAAYYDPKSLVIFLIPDRNQFPDNVFRAGADIEYRELRLGCIRSDGRRELH